MIGIVFKYHDEFIMAGCNQFGDVIKYSCIETNTEPYEDLEPNQLHIVSLQSEEKFEDKQKIKVDHLYRLTISEDIDDILDVGNFDVLVKNIYTTIIINKEKPFYLH